MSGIKGVELTIFILLFALVSMLGFLASRWRRAQSLDHLDEWGPTDATSAPGSPGS